MTKKDKELLTKDLCARLPYGVMCNIQTRFVFEDGTLRRGSYDKILDLETVTEINSWYESNELEKLKPYLRPMSSMTEEEREELSDYLCEQVMSNKIGITIPPNPTQGKGIPFIWMGDCMDWLNAHHFDYRGLIEKGLALEAPEDMYK